MGRVLWWRRRRMASFLYKTKVLVSKSLGQEELRVGLEDLKTLHILHRDFPETLQGHKMERKY